MTVRELLEEFARKGIVLFYQDGELRYRAPKSAMTRSFRQLILDKKKEIVAYLSSGASGDAIQLHYDISNDFYKLWLDRTLTYSCALFTDEEIECGSLLNEIGFEQAQIRKLEYHIRESGVKSGMRVLDIGCGWGALLNQLVTKHNVTSATGITLSNAQLDYIRQLNLRRTNLYLQSWENHEYHNSYDAIVSVGAMEHFVRPSTPHEIRKEIYRKFFAKCHDLLRPEGLMSLQTIAYGRGNFRGGALWSIFPESDLPRFSEIVESMSDYFEIVRLRNDPKHYAFTVKHWRNKLQINRKQIVDLIGEVQFNHYQRYLQEGIWEIPGFCSLLRITLKRLPLKSKISDG